MSEVINNGKRVPPGIVVNKDILKRYKDKLNMTPEQIGLAILALIEYAETDVFYEGNDMKVARLFDQLVPSVDYSIEQYVKKIENLDKWKKKKKEEISKGLELLNGVATRDEDDNIPHSLDAIDADPDIPF